MFQPLSEPAAKVVCDLERRLRRRAEYEAQLKARDAIIADLVRAVALAHAALTEADEHRARKQAEALAFIRGANK
jgi:hypothetical protein